MYSSCTICQTAPPDLSFDNSGKALISYRDYSLTEMGVTVQVDEKIIVAGTIDDEIDLLPLTGE